MVMQLRKRYSQPEASELRQSERQAISRGRASRYHQAAQVEVKVRPR